MDGAEREKRGAAHHGRSDSDGGKDHLRDCPELVDISDMGEILRTLGCGVHRDGGTLEIDPGGLTGMKCPKRWPKDPFFHFCWGPFCAVPQGNRPFPADARSVCGPSTCSLLVLPAVRGR